ncbi:urease accessory protein UreD [Phreatobacter oligotrophus]|uniref:Urease accessory protein UreD n=1 Tax=Phreatobacter oligotrophus TaxID=1122261 RepID=A0A2T4Z5I7_9HYPH|nr:urease accessory protein UreD [Phreatobacter oligotrophus]PTM57157.1 urease accessory protein [Phreatobacter oligotrophus]
MLADHASAAAGDVFAWRSAGATMQRAHGVGRLGFALRDGRTAVMTCYQEAGLRIRMPRVEPGAPLEAVVINTAGGITGGDRFTLDIDAGEGTRAVVTSQAAEKVYRSSGAVGTFSTAIRVGQGASMAWLPQEAILFDGSALDRSLDITMAADSTVLAVESVVFGRLARGESVATGRLFDRWRIRRGGRLVYAEGLRFDGAVAARLDAKACAAGAIAAASLVLVAADAEQRVDTVRERTEALCERGVEAGVSGFDGMLSLRLLARDPFAMRTGLVDILEHLHGPLPRVWSC